jgi:hypothetical protein
MEDEQAVFPVQRFVQGLVMHEWNTESRRITNKNPWTFPRVPRTY